MVLPGIIHNLQGYDAHLFIKNLAKVPGDLSSIPATEEKYISFSKFIEVDQYFSKKKRKNFSSKNLKYVLSILSSFFKHHLTI